MMMLGLEEARVHWKTKREVNVSFRAVSGDGEILQGKGSE